MNKTNTITSLENSVFVPVEILDWLKEHRNNFTTNTAFAKDVGIDRSVLNRIMIVGTCNSNTLNRLKKSFKRHAAKTAA